MKIHDHIFERIVSVENLFVAWHEFCKGKRSRKDVQEFEWRLEEHIFALHHDLLAGTYRHGAYTAFNICDPKQRRIHKATVRDRVVHHAVFSMLNPLFEPAFISHSYSCRKGKGTHKGVDALEKMLLQGSRNHTRNCFALKCDIHAFFASVDHEILLRLLAERITDERALQLLRNIIDSFHNEQGKGIPIGNLTSQLFANVYMNELDQFVKHRLKVKRYVRYTDDFVIVSHDERYLCELLPHIRSHLKLTLRLDLHPTKIGLRKYRQGIDFLGYVLLPHHRALRTKTKKRMTRKLREKLHEYAEGHVTKEHLDQSLQSYFGVLSHADTYGLQQDLRNDAWLRSGI